LVRLWVYNPRNGILMRHGFEEPGDVQDIRLVVSFGGQRISSVSAAP
jgi:hypothetical protein